MNHWRLNINTNVFWNQGNSSSDHRSEWLLSSCGKQKLCFIFEGKKMFVVFLSSSLQHYYHATSAVCNEQNLHSLQVPQSTIKFLKCSVMCIATPPHHASQEFVMITFSWAHEESTFHRLSAPRTSRQGSSLAMTCLLIALNFTWA